MSSLTSGLSPTLILEAKTAADLMTPNVVSISPMATLGEAVAVLKEKRITAMPVCDESGNSVGVLSRSDLVCHDPAEFECLQPDLEQFTQRGFIVRIRHGLSQVFHTGKTVPRHVKDLMTPVVFSVAQETPVSTVIDAMLSLGLHRLFVTRNDGKITGVISAIDVIRHLHAQNVVEAEPAEDPESGLCLDSPLESAPAPA
jgi:CBS domain-containing protein